MSDDLNAFKPIRVLFGRHETQPDHVTVEAKRIRITMPHPKMPKEIVTLTIGQTNIIKVICHLDVNPTLVIRVQKECMENIHKQLHIEENTSQDCQNSDTVNWIVIETETMTDTVKDKFKQVIPIYDEIPTDAIKKFVKLKIKSLNMQAGPNVTVVIKDGNEKQQNKSLIDDSRTNHIITYPSSGVGAVTINRSDYECLAIDEFLNDVIIEFYLQYITREILTEEQRKKTHIFNTFFYEALSAKPPREASTLSVAERRYGRVENWTKHVNLFEKDFIVVPINQHQHWFLAIICFPGLNKPATKSNKRKTTAKQTIKFDSDDSDSSDGANESTKRPCILIFDSMSAGERKVTTVLREYLNCEYKHKMHTGLDVNFDAQSMPGHKVRVPQQTNFSDCGLFMLQYIEQFFKDPIKNFDKPIKNLENWFDTSVPTNKRNDIVNIIKKQMLRHDSCCNLSVEDLPKIKLP